MQAIDQLRTVTNCYKIIKKLYDDAWQKYLVDVCEAIKDLSDASGFPVQVNISTDREPYIAFEHTEYDDYDEEEIDNGVYVPLSELSKPTPFFDYVEWDDDEIFEPYSENEPAYILFDKMRNGRLGSSVLSLMEALEFLEMQKVYLQELKGRNVLCLRKTGWLE